MRCLVWPRGLWIAVAAGICLAGANLLAATFSLTPRRLDFGAQALGTASATQIVVLRNGSKKSALQYGVTVTGDYTFLDRCLGTAAPNASCEIEVRFSPTATGSRSGTLTITDTTKPSNRDSVRLSGTGVEQTTVAPASLSFGNIATGTTSPAQTVTLTNNLDRALTAVSLTTSLSDYAVGPGCSSTLAARSSCTATVTFSPTAPPGTLESATLTIAHDAATSPQIVALSGTSVVPYSLSATSLTIPPTFQGQTGTAALSLTNNQSVPLAGVTLATALPFGATGCAGTIPAAGTCAITTTFSPTTQLGPVVGTLTVTAPLPNGTAAVELNAVAVQPVVVTPAALNLGSVTVGSTSGTPLVVTVTNQQPTPLTFGSPMASFTGPAAADYSVVSTTCPTPPAALAGNATCTIGVAFVPTQGGSRSATLAVNSDAYGSPQAVALSGVGTTPVTVSPAAVEFGDANVGLASAPHAVTFRNNQSVPVTIAAITASGDFAVHAPGTTCGTTIPATAECVVAVVMTPTLVGPRAGALVMTSDASESPNMVPLSGTGVNGVTAAPLSLTFAPQPVNTTSGAQVVTLTNHQAVDAPLTLVATGDFAATAGCGTAIPALGTCLVSVTFTPTDIGPRAGNLALDYGYGVPIAVSLAGTGASTTPPAAVADVTPGAGTLGTTVLGAVVTGNDHTHFSPSSLVDFGGGVGVSNLRNVSATSLTVDLAIESDAVPGGRTVTVTTPLAGGDIETASLADGFVVFASSDRSIVSATPGQGAQAQTLEVAIVGDGTHFAQGVTFANFGDGVSVNSLTVHTQTSATANVTVSPTATLGWRALTLATGGEIATLAPVGSGGPGFNVVAGPAALVSVSPSSGSQGGAPFVVSVTGAATHFQQGVTQVSFGDGIDVGAVTVTSATELTASIAVTAGAAIGPRTITATTGGEVATLVDGFGVTAAPVPTLSSVTPGEGRQGQTLLLSLVGEHTKFTTDAPAPSLTLGSSIALTSLTVNDDTHITAAIDIDALAQVGARQGILSSGGTIFPFDFTVLPSGAAVAGVSPAGGPQGGTVAVTVSGQGTHWQAGSTSAAFQAQSCPVPSVARVTVSSPTTAVLDLEIPANACVGPLPFYLATGGEVVGASFGIYGQTASLVLSPTGAVPVTTLTVNFLGEFTHFGAGTTAVIAGTGVTIEGFAVTSPATATATFVVAPGALPGARTVTLTTPLGGGAFEVVSAQFAVTSTPAVLTEITPFHAAPGATTLVTIRGSLTSFDGSTTVGFGPGIATSSLTVIGATELSVEVSVGAEAAVGWRQAFVNTGDEQLTIGFRVDGPAAPAISSVSPSTGAQGESLSVTITGANTSFNAESQLVLGAGVTVAEFQVTSPTSATAVVAIDPTAPVGQNAVLVLTPTGPGQQEIAAGAGFSVVRGPASILSVTPDVAAQSQVLHVQVVGQGTHWLQGATTADFGPGIVVNQLTVHDATHATAQVTVLSTAPLGFRTVALITDGEYAALAQGFGIEEGTPVLLSSSPNAGAQATTFDVQVLGRFTHWEQAATAATYGPGIAVNSVTVVDSVSAVLNVTIDPTAFATSSPGCAALTMTTGAEQVSLANQLCVTPGAAALTSVSPNAAPQGSTLTVQVTGQNTHFTAGLTTAHFGDGINTSNVTVTSPTTASVDLAVSTQAASGFRTATLTTLGEVASLALAFEVGPNTPTLNGASPFSGQRGQILTARLIGQYTHWQQGITTVTFGEGITVGGVTVIDATTLDVGIVIDSLAVLGGRLVTVTTGGEIVSAPVFSVLAGGAILSQVAPQSGNQGQQIVLSLTGQNTNWQQGFTQFSMTGAGGDLAVNFVVVNSPTSATVGIAIGPNATLGARSIYMVTGAEVLVAGDAFIVTGGVPAIGSVSPGSARAGETGLNVQISGLHTRWLAGATTVDFGPGVAVSSFTVNSDTSITAVVEVDPAAGLGPRTVVVRNVAGAAVQALTGYFQVVSPQPPTPYISYLSPTSGLRGQTFTVAISGQHTHWDPAPNATRIDFGDPAASGITVNSFQVTGPTSVRANISIAPDAAFGPRTISIVTTHDGSDEVVQAGFSVVQEVPTLTIVDPASGMQGSARTVNVLGQYTGFNDGTTFDFGAGVTVDAVTVLGANVAQVVVTVDQLAPQGFRYVTATTDGRVVSGAGFSVTPSQAVIVSVSPNTARQQETLEIEVAGQNTTWNGSTVFSLGGGITVGSAQVHGATQATLTITVDALAGLGARSISATTGGEVASLANAFVVQPGTPLVLSSSPGSGQQQANVTLTILGQATAWDGTTTVDLGAGVVVDLVTATSGTSLTVQAHVEPLAQPGFRTLTVTTGPQVLTLANAFAVTPGPAAISLLSPEQAGQGETLDVAVTGVNTHFAAGTTTADFGAGLTVNGVSVLSATAAVVNVTVAPSAAVGQRTVTLATPYEVAAVVNGFTVLQTVPFIQFVSPSTGAQGSTIDVTVVGSLTAFDETTTFDFGPGVTVNSVTPTSATHATVNVTVSPVAQRTTRAVSATTAGVTASGANLFTVTAGPAYVSAIAPAAAPQGRGGLEVSVSGYLTHFTAGTPVVDLGPGVTITGVIVDSDTQLRATVDVSPSAPVQARDVVVTTLGEVATLPGGFQVAAATPVILSAAPSSAYQAQTLDVLVTGEYTSFAQGATTASFGPGILVNLVTVHGATSATVNVTVGADAGAGLRTVTMTTGAQVASGAVFEVLARVVPVITWTAPSPITYGTALDATQLNATADVPGTFVYTPAAGSYLPAGDASALTVQFTPDDTVRYAIASATVSIDVSPATLLVTPDDKVKGFGQLNPTLTYTVTGFVAGDTAGVVGGAPELATTASESSPVGTYPITATPGTLSAANYTFTFGTGTLTVVGASLSTLVQHVGQTDPRTEGFLDRGGIQSFGAVASDGGFAAWQVSGSGCCSYFHHPVDYATAFQQGWRLSGRLRVVDAGGVGYIGLNPAADRPRFDVKVASVGGDAMISLAGTALSYTVPGAAGHWLAIELAYDPVTASAALFVDGVRRLNGYTGWSEALENRGVLFGTDTGTVNFSLVRFDLGSLVVDFEDLSDSIPSQTPFPQSYRGITWTNWLHYAPYFSPYQPDGVNAIYAAVDGATFTFSERTFLGAEFSRFPGSAGDIYFELYRGGSLVWTSSPLADAPPQRTLLASGYAGPVDEVRVRSLGASMTGAGSAWMMDNVTFGSPGAKATPVLTWPAPAPISYGTPLGAAQLSATANVQGTFVYSPAAGTLLPVGPAQPLSVLFTPADTVHYENAATTVFLTVVKAAQAPLVVTGAPATAGNGTTFTVGTSGGSGTGTVTFAVTGICTNTDGGAVVTMTAATGTCTITATKAADDNYEAATSAPVFVTASGSLPPALDVVESSLALAVPSDRPAIPGRVSVRLQLGGVSVAAPSGGVSLTATSSDTTCVTAGGGTIAAGAYSASTEIAYGGSATLPCTATVTVTSTEYGSDEVPVGVYPYATAPITAAETAVSYYNPAPMPNPAGTLATSVAAMSYYNPAPMPNPTGTLVTSVAAVSYYNPASLLSPGGSVGTSVAAVSYFNPAPLPDPGGAVASGVAAVSYYNPATVPGPGNIVATGVASLSYLNPAPEGVTGPGDEQAPATEALAAEPAAAPEVATRTSSVSVANGPTATGVRPVVLARGGGTAYTLTVFGANLSGATAVVLADVEFGVTTGAPMASPDGRRLTVDVFVAADAPLGAFDVVVIGPGWQTPGSPRMRVEIVP